MRICMYLDSAISHDGRVKREAAYLAAAGHDVFVISRLEPDKPRTENWKGARFIRLGFPGRRIFELLRVMMDARARRKQRASDQIKEESSVAPEGIRDIKEIKDRGYPRSIDWFHPRVRCLLQSLSWVSAGLFLRADAYHAHDIEALPYAYLCAKLTDRKLVYDSHELHIDWYQARRYSVERIRFLEKVENRCARSADLLITVSEGIAEELKRLYNIPKPLVVRNCPELKPLVRLNRIREEIGGEWSRPIVLYHGIFEPHRGLSELVKAADTVPEADFVLLGPELPYKKMLQEMSSQGRHGNVYFLPPVAQEVLWEYTHSADIGVIQTQPFSLSFKYAEANKLFEYLAAGIPVVASNTEAHQHLSKETQAMFLTDPYKPPSIAEAIRKLARDPQQRKEMGLRGRRAVEQTYNSSAEMKKLIQAYERLNRQSRR